MVCKIKNCLGCGASPPTLSPRALKEIGSALCDLQADQLDEDTLLSKNKLEPVGKKIKKNKEGRVNKKNQNGDEKEGSSNNDGKTNHKGS
jgi:hypothetical protein